MYEASKLALVTIFWLMALLVYILISTWALALADIKQEVMLN